jgi:hypothetical protein
LLERYAEQGGDVKKLLEEKAKEPFSWGGKTALGIVINSSPKETATFLESMEWLAKQPNTLNPFLADFGRCVGH